MNLIGRKNSEKKVVDKKKQIYAGIRRKDIEAAMRENERETLKSVV
jgi:hypothetical protein